MRNFTFLLALTLLLAGPAARAVTVTILVGDDYYSPINATAKVGDVVKWQYVTGSVRTHPTSSDTGAWSTFIINSATPTYSMTVMTVGNFPYHCNLHGAPGLGMYGTLAVSAALPTLPAQSLAALEVYPNPATATVRLLVGPVPAPGPATVQVVGALGNLVRAQAVGVVQPGQQLTLEVADLPAGLYVCRLLVGSEVVGTQRLVLLN